MLTLKAPLELKCNPSMISSHEAFYHRITGNYGLLSAGIDKEDLLHVVTAPPELYVEEGGMTSIVQNTRIQNSQETKLEIINNLLNRIAVMEEIHLTYQDRVYITDVLQKLGVRNVSRFMEQVSRLKQETQTTEQLISLYWNHLEELTRQIETWHSQEKETETVRMEQEKDRPVFTLHEEIMNRLKTGAVYQILNNFYTSYNGNSRTVTRQELQITEQKRVAVQVLLHQLRREVKGGKLPLIYRHDNYYEQMEPEEGVPVEEQISSQITSAVLLNLIDNLYLNRFERQQNRMDTWLSMVHALYQTAENTLYRLKAGLNVSVNVQKEQKLWSIRQQQYKEQELYFVRELLTAGEEAEKRFSVLWNQYGEDSIRLLENRYYNAEIQHIQKEEVQREDGFFPQTAELREAEAQQESKSSEKKDREEVKKADSEKETPGTAGLSRAKEQKARAEIQEQILIKETAKALGIQMPEKKEKPEPVPAKIRLRPQVIPEETLETNTSIDTELQWVQEGQMRLYQMIEQYLRVSDLKEREAERGIWPAANPESEQLLTILKQTETHVRTETGETKGEPLEAAETVLLKWQGQNQETVFLGEAEKREDIIGEQGQKLSRSAGDTAYPSSSSFEESLMIDQSSHVTNTTDIHMTEGQKDAFIVHEESLLSGDERETSQEIMKQQILKINQQNIANLDIYRELLRQTKQKQTKKAPARRDMRRDSLKALQDPDSLMKEYQAEAQEQKLQEQKQTEQIMELLPEQTRRVYEKLEQYLSSSGQEQGGAVNNLGMLLRDIKTAEISHRTKEQVQSEEVSRIQETSETILEKWKETALPEVKTFQQSQREQTENRISLVHKSVDHQIDQEMLEQLIEQNRLTKGKNIVTKEETQDRELVRKTVHQQTQQVISKENEDLTELIQRGVQRQIGVLSEQIYTRLEKRLQNEKKRRGY